MHSNRIELDTEKAKKCRSYSCLYMSVVAVASPLSLVDGFFAGRSDVLSAAGFVAVVFFFVARAVVAPEEFSPARICVHFLNLELLCLLFRVSCI